MYKYRNKLPKKTIVFEQRAFKLLDYLFSSNGQLIINNHYIKLEFNKQVNRKINQFDFVILCALISIYESIGCNKIFNLQLLLKIVKGNKNARFIKEAKKQQTLNIPMFLNSIEFLVNLNICIINKKEIKSEANSLGLIMEDFNLVFKNRPCILNLFELLNIQSIKYDTLNLDLFKNCSIQENLKLTNFKFNILSRLVTNNKVIIEINEIKNVTGILNIEQKAMKDLYLKRITKKIYCKRIYSYKFKLNIFIKFILISLKQIEIINTVTVEKDKIIIFK